uniref:Uncharacterized protein n=1 Tax=Knipowitschia caucasica TaxID=637954 RepID=A0AAV2MIG2_KNICA
MVLTEQSKKSHGWIYGTERSGPNAGGITSGELAHNRRLPLVTVIPTFPKDVQIKLDAREPCHQVSKIRIKICIDEVDRIHPTVVAFCDRFREGFVGVLPNILKLAQGKSTVAKQYTDVRHDALVEDLPGIDLRAGLILLPSIFREKIEHYITLGERDVSTPYPTIQLMENDWKVAMTNAGPSLVKVDGVDVCQCTTFDEAFITAYSMYFVFNIAYPPHLKNTLSFLQRRIVSIVEEGDKTLPITVLRIINQF